jgi:simple sugar transport system permease protein
VGITGYYYLFSAMPYVLTLIILVMTCTRQQVIPGAPSELGAVS